jgi:anti-anti-sigma regulatory factor
MMKAQFRERDGEIVLHVCGRLADEWVHELEKSWQESRTRLVDLRGVSFVDPAGRRLLQRMHREGATFLASGLLIQEVVAQVTGSK